MLLSYQFSLPPIIALYQVVIRKDKMNCRDVKDKLKLFMINLILDEVEPNLFYKNNKSNSESNLIN